MQRDDVTWGRGWLYGTLAFVVGYALTGVLTLATIDAAAFDDTSQETTIGWLFTNAHGVRIREIDAAPNQVFNLIAAENTYSPDLTSMDPLFYLIPVVVLVSAGYLVARGALSHEIAPEQAVKVGATLATGYLVLTLVATFTLFTAPERYWTTRPELETAVVVMGIGYPVVFGAIGGYLGGR